MDVDLLLHSLGKYSRFQVIVFLLMGLVVARGPWHIIAVDFMGPTIPHHCSVPDYVSLNESQLLEDRFKCTMFTTPAMNATSRCDDWAYNSSESLSITQEWNLVCSRNYMSELSSTIFMIGASCGALFIIPLADRFGRKPILLMSLWTQLILGIGTSFVNSFVAFSILRFFIGALNQTIGLVSFLMVAEVFPSSSRAVPSIAIYIFWSVGIMFLSLMAYTITQWRNLQLAVSVPSAITLLYYWILPESIPWLVVKKKDSTLRQVVSYASRINRKFLELDDFHSSNDTTLETGVGYVNSLHCDKNNPSKNIKYQSVELSNLEHNRSVIKTDNQNCVSSVKSGESNLAVLSKSSRHSKFPILDVFRKNRMLYYTVVMSYLWSINSFLYFGILFALPTFHGDQYLNMFLSGVVEIPAYLICIFALQCCGRRKPLCLFMILCGISSAAYVFTPIEAGGVSLSSLKITLVMVAKFSITGSYSTAYLFAAEIFPTVIRNQALGLTAFFENIGSIASPFIAYSAKSISWLPMALFGILSAMGGFLCLTLPETHKCPMLETVEDADKFR